jgi:hypothetical protein
MFTSTVSTSTRPSEISPFNFFGANAEVGVMAQVSRPFQIALLAVAVIAAVWAVALRGSSKTVTPAAPASVASTPPSASTEAKSASGGSGGANSAGAHSKIYHGSAPGVNGLTRAINKAHGAVATSEQNAKQLEGKSAQASGETTSGTSAPSASKSASASTPAAASKSASASKPASGSQAAKSTASKSAQAGLPARERSVEKALSAGKVVVILFWNPNGADDVAVHHELQLLLKAHRSVGSHGQVAESLVKTFGRELDRKIAVFEASAAQVATFGSITRGVQVSGTPTTLIVNPKGQTTTLTGLQDGYAIEQAINEARHS